MTTGIVTDWNGLARQLGQGFASRAAFHDVNDAFVHDNFEELRAHRIFAAAVPTELGGGGASLADLCDLHRELAHYCSSTALALSMHTHQVFAVAWRWQNEHAPVNAFLERIAKEQPIIVSTGASDWLDGSGTAEKVDGGFRVSGRKVFASGSPAGAMLMTSAVFNDPEAGEVVLHFPVSLDAAGVRISDTWRALGMRGTGSNDIELENVFVPDAAVGARRPRGKWTVFHLGMMNALPIIYSVYVGIAEAARNEVLARPKAGKKNSTELQIAVGQMETELRAAQIALQSAVDYATKAQPGPEATNEILIRRTLAGEAAVRCVESAFSIGGGSAFLRSSPLERMWRDVQAARFHPLQANPQAVYSGKFALGLDVD